MKICECSSRGYKPASAFYAKVKCFDKLDSIENHYQSVKRDKYGNKVKKGQRVDHIEIYGRHLSPVYLTPFYKLLWVKYLDNNPNVVEYLSNFDDYNDMFKGQSINCQADVIRQYMKQGRQSFFEDPSVKEFITILNRLKKNID